MVFLGEKEVKEESVKFIGFLNLENLGWVFGSANTFWCWL
jgi:hypothetical protein